MTTPQAPSRIWATSSSPPAIDLPIKQDANFAGNPASLRQYRSYRDSQILGLETHLVQSLVGGLTGTIVPVSSTPILPGQWVCSTGNGVVPALAGALAAAGLPLGIALTTGAPGGLVRIALGGLVPSQVTGMLAGGSSLYGVINTSTGFTLAKSAPALTDYPVGAIDSSGNLALQIQLPASVASGATWTTALDLDFTAQANDTFGSDGAFTFAGFTWTKYRSANDAVALANVSGTGLVFQPGASSAPSAGALGFPRLSVGMTSVIPGLGLDWPLRVSARIASLSSGADTEAVLVLAPTIDGGGGYQNYYLASKGQTNVFAVTGSAHTSGSSSTYTDSVAYAAYDTITLYLPGGIAGSQVTGMACAASVAPFYWFGSVIPTQTAGANSGLLSNWSVSVGALRNGTTTNCTFSHLKVEFVAR